ncbi:MauE/DoxX family redox-associated membrane protein [uncultured Flavobacterium sp.]|uniref:DoxX family protein n=1 Tax=uncultured Flavobacterium sp. TaxID=165435 RepID=UPI0025D54172|nr:MauE/DoxX family redox-associated membrane protein [uncultured Flavobacterium sp.]
MMETVNQKIKAASAEFIAYSYIMLFIYAAANKLLAFDSFQVQLAQSPLLSAFAGWISWLVPALEIMIALGLMAKKCRPVFLFLSFTLMAMFSVYIAIMLYCSPFVPCSCGGILEKLGWEEHLAFNVLFVLLGIMGFLLETAGTRTAFRKASAITAGLLLGTAIVAVLFLVSEDMIRHRNNFTRRFPHHPAELRHELDLKSEAYYIAGSGNGAVFLGSHASPLTVTVVDSALHRVNKFAIALETKKRPYNSLRITVAPPHFFVSDGTETFIFRGRTADWKARLWSDRNAYFNAIVPIDSTAVAIRAISSQNHENVLGILKGGSGGSVSLHPLLEKQIDGIFDTAGSLLYNPQVKKLLYVYAYRNEFFITDARMAGKTVGHTIDTVSRVKIKVAFVGSEKGSKIASPALKVNNAAATFGNYLFVHAALMGKFEPRSMWDEASVIDAYAISDQSYRFSFYVYGKRKKKMRDFILTQDRLYALVGQYLTVYRLRDTFYEKKQ